MGTNTSDNEPNSTASAAGCEEHRAIGAVGNALSYYEGGRRIVHFGEPRRPRRNDSAEPKPNRPLVRRLTGVGPFRTKPPLGCAETSGNPQRFSEARPSVAFRDARRNLLRRPCLRQSRAPPRAMRGGGADCSYGKQFRPAAKVKSAEREVTGPYSTAAPHY